MAEDKNRLARFGASQGGLAAYNRWGAPVIRPVVQRGRDAVAYARIAGTKELAEEMAQVAAKSVGQSASEAGLRGSLAVAERFGQSAARGMVNRGFDGVLRYGTEGALLETPAAGRLTKYLSGLHRPPILSGPKAGGRVDKILRFVAEHTPGVQKMAVKAAGSVSTGATGGVATGLAKGLAKQAFSKAGLAAGFAASGVMDTVEGAWDFAHTPGHTTDIKNWEKVRTAIYHRIIPGLMRGVDGALFGLPSFIPGYTTHLAGGEDYMSGEYSQDGSPRAKLMEAAQNAGGLDKVSAQEWADYARKCEDNYAAGRDEDGFAEPGVSKEELERRKEENKMLQSYRKRGSDWRKNMLYEVDAKADPKAPDVNSLRNAVMALAARHDARMSDLAHAYGDNDSFVSTFTARDSAGRYLPKGAVGFRDRDPVTGENVLDALIRRGDGEGIAAFRERKLGLAAQRHAREMDREFSRLRGFTGFGDLVEAVRRKASDVYHRVARTRGYTKDEAAQGFDALWSGMSEYQKATLDTGKFAQALAAEPAAGQEEPK